MGELCAQELMVLSSIQLFMANPKFIRPEAFGTGCIVKYRGSHYLLSVFHVINHEDLALFMETNWPPLDELSVPVVPVGGFVYFDLLKIKTGDLPEDLVDIIEKGGERLDITFAKIDPLPEHELMQEPVKLGPLSIAGQPKQYLDFDFITEPNHTELYGFYGKVDHQYEGIYLKMRPTLKDNLTYLSSSKGFHKFLAPEIITRKEDYMGCSGAPILDSEGRLVALACKVVEGMKLIYGFSIQECKRLLDIAIDARQFDKDE